MQATPQDIFERRYQELTPRQKAIVDAWVQHPNATNREIATDHAPEIFNAEYLVESADDDPIETLNESYCSQFSNQDEIKQLIDYRQGSPVDAAGPNVSQQPTFDPDSPANGHVSIPQSALEVATDEQGVVVRMQWSAVESVLGSQELPVELQQALVSALVAKASE